MVDTCEWCGNRATVRSVFVDHNICRPCLDEYLTVTPTEPDSVERAGKIVEKVLNEK